MAAKGLLLRLKDYQVKASAAEKNAVTIILNHPDMVIGKSIHEFADWPMRRRRPLSDSAESWAARDTVISSMRLYTKMLCLRTAGRYLFRRSSPRRRQRTLFKRLHEKTSSLLRRQESW